MAPWADPRNLGPRKAYIIKKPIKQACSTENVEFITASRWADNDKINRQDIEKLKARHKVQFSDADVLGGPIITSQDCLDGTEAGLLPQKCRLIAEVLSIIIAIAE